jgi:hypothetical protein
MSQKHLVNTHATERAAREWADEKRTREKGGRARKAKRRDVGRGARLRRRVPQRARGSAAPSCAFLRGEGRQDEDQDATGQAAVRRTAGALGLAPAILVLAAFLATAATVRPGLTTSMGASPTSMPRCTTER